MEIHNPTDSGGEEKWLNIRDYAKLIGNSKAQVYLDIRTGKMPKEKVRKIEKKVSRLQILV